MDNGCASSGEPLAIVGMGCRIPGGNNSPIQFWEFLLSKKSGITLIPNNRWNIEKYFDDNPDGLGTSVAKWGGFLDDIREFDCQFFGISPREAASMDPQQRLLLQVTYEAIEDSRTSLKDLAQGQTGVFVGASQSDYRTIQELRPSNPEAFAGTGYAMCINANRISHRLNLSGPSFTVDTACSSSMVALNQAEQSLRTRACDVAIVAGANVILHPSSYMAFSRAGMLSATGAISTFDSRANGFVRAEAVGVVVIKPLEKARANGDRVHALLHATACNQDGQTNTLMSPSQAAQTAMLEELFERSNLKAEQVGFVEAHGTGTPIGDPIEAGAIGKVIGQKNKDRKVYVGSGKTNVGHSEAAAGITGLIKAVMAVKNGIVPPNINYLRPNPSIPFDILNLEVPIRAERFPRSEGKRVAVVNSFGFGGTNACALISSAPDEVVAPRSAAKPALENFPYFFPLSAASRDGLALRAGSFVEALSKRGKLRDVSLQDLSCALANNTSHLINRAVVLARDRDELVRALKLLSGNDADAIENASNIVVGLASKPEKLCFMFSGQGSQWWAMGRGFLRSNPVFAQTVDAYDELFQAAAGWSIKQELMKDEGVSNIDDTTVTQPALFAIQAGLAAVWKSFGVTPDIVVGHSIGEAAASYVAGGISLEGAARFLSKRGAIRDQLNAKGAMAAIGLNVEDVEEFLPDAGKVNIAAINGPASTTVSGDKHAIDSLVEELSITHPDTLVRKLRVDTAWHSYQLEGGEDWFRDEVKSIDWSVPKIPFVSTVTGDPETKFDVDYGWLNLRQPVLFQKGIETALKLGAKYFVELGPHGTLLGPAMSTAAKAEAVIQVFQSLSRKDPDFDKFAQTAAGLFVIGMELDWQAITGDRRVDLDLPPLDWKTEPLWLDSEESRARLYSAKGHPFLGSCTASAAYEWKSEFNTKSYPYLKEHRLQAETIFPAAGYLDMGLAAGHELFGERHLEIKDAIIHEAVFVPDDADMLFCTHFSEDRKKIRLLSRTRDSRDDWQLRFEAFLSPTDVDPPRKMKFDPVAKAANAVDVSKLYDVDSSSEFINYGDSFQVVKELWVSPQRATARISAGENFKDSLSQFFAHPALLDGCFQLADPRVSLKGLKVPRQAGDDVTLPIGVRRLRFFGQFPSEMFVHVMRSSGSSKRNPEAKIIATNLDGQVLLTAEGLIMRALSTQAALDNNEELVPEFAQQTMVEVHDSSPEEIELSEGQWILFGASGQDVDSIKLGLEEAGKTVHLVRRDQLGDNISYELSDRFGDSFDRGEISGIVYACPLAIPPVSKTVGSEELQSIIETSVIDLINLGDLMDLYRTCELGLARIVVLTAGGFPDLQGTAEISVLTQSPVQALTRVLASETPEYDVRLIDCGQTNMPEKHQLVAAILSNNNESELVLSDHRKFAPRLQKVERDHFEPRLLNLQPGEADTNFHVTLRSPGVIDDMELWEIPMGEIGRGQARVRVSAVGLNFRDVMAVTGLLPDEAEPDPAWQHLGLEFAGVVEEVGEGVISFKPGDRVMGMNRRCLQRFLTLDQNALTPIPENISLAEAATIPSAFATAHYALNRVGHLSRGEKVLLHVATGGVGSAAVQLAKKVGAEIFATAGSPQKRKILRDLGIKNVFNSRSLKFADEIERVTSGQGVDVVLNSLPDQYITKGLEILAPYGRFLEIGKRDVYADSAIGMKALRKNVSFSVLDMAAMGRENPDLLSSIMDELVPEFANGTLHPLQVTEFPVSQICEAFRFMSQARHTGKVVVRLDGETLRVRRDMSKPVSLSSNSSYLVTGGTQGFGLTIANWMSKAGAGELILASRSAKIADADRIKIAAMEKRGTKISVERLDVTSQTDVEKFIAKAVKAKRPLSGVVHGAAVIKDGFVSQQTREMIQDVLRPKIMGGWNLHRAFEAVGVQPEFMIGFSSIAQTIGSPAQSNYVAANAFLDALSQYRTTNGLSGVTIDWGALAESGFVARNEGLANYLESLGLGGLTDVDSDAGMEVALTTDTTGFIYAKADWEKISKANLALGRTARFAPMLRSTNDKSLEVRAYLMSLSDEKLLKEAASFIKREVCSVLKVEASEIQSDRSMAELGLDSLSSFELKMRIESALDVFLPVSKFLQAPSIDELAVVLSDEVIVMQNSAANAVDQAGDGSNLTPGSMERGNAYLPTNQQLGLLQEMTCDGASMHAKRAMEYYAEDIISTSFEMRDLARAINKVAKRHPMLRLGFDSLEKEAKFHLEGGGPILVEDLKNTPLDVSAGEFCRVCVGGDRIRVALHRIIGDQASAELVLRELRTLLEKRALDRAPVKQKLFRALSELRFDPDSDQGANDLAFWRYSSGFGAPPVEFARRSRALLPLELGRNRGQSATIMGELEQFQNEADLMIRFASAIRKATKSTGTILISRVRSMRKVCGDLNAVGPFEVQQPILVMDDSDNPVIGAHLERVLQHADLHRSIDSYGWIENLNNGSAPADVSPFQFGFNVVEQFSDAGCSEYDICLEICGKSFCLNYDTDIVEESMAHSIVAFLASGE